MTTGSVGTSVGDAVRDIVRGRDGEKLDSALDAFGVADAMDVEPAAVIRVLYEELGRGLRTSRGYDYVVLHAVGAPIATHAVVMPHTWYDDSFLSRREGDRIRVQGNVLGQPAGRKLVVPVIEGDAVLLRAMPGAAVSESEAVAVGVDETLTVTVVDNTVDFGAFEEVPQNASWADVRDSLVLAMAGELVGIGRRATELAVEYVTHRQQFDRAIGSFQAVKHLLADSIVALEGASTALDFALATRNRLDVLAASSLGRIAAVTSTQNAMQVCGGIAHSWEFDLHRYQRRALALIGLAGAPEFDLAAHVGPEVGNAFRSDTQTWRVA